VAGRRWYLLIHQLPTKPIYLRAKIGQRLSRIGALGLKNSVYVLPGNRNSLENLRRILEEARAAGGEAYISEAEFVGGITSESLVRRFRSARDADYEALSAEVHEAVASINRRDGVRMSAAEGLAQLARLKKRLGEIEAIDFFNAAGKKRSEALLASLEKRLQAAGKDTGVADSSSTVARFKGRVWVTRRGLLIDRIASAWLIRRFIDSDAHFRFIDPKEERKQGELRFDMVGGDFTHEGDSCTFETLIRVVKSPDPALRQVAEIVHDVDLKDGKFARPDALGVQQIILGIVLDCPDDEDRLKRGFALFDDLYASFRQRSPKPSKSPSNHVGTTRR
jgi:hypothetical protein